MKVVHIWPVPGAWLPGIPAAEQDVPEKEAARLVATGAFSLEPPESGDVSPGTSVDDTTDASGAES